MVSATVGHYSMGTPRVIMPIVECLDFLLRDVLPEPLQSLQADASAGGGSSRVESQPTAASPADSQRLTEQLAELPPGLLPNPAPGLADEPMDHPPPKLPPRLLARRSPEPEPEPEPKPQQPVHLPPKPMAKPLTEPRVGSLPRSLPQPPSHESPVQGSPQAPDRMPHSSHPESPGGRPADPGDEAPAGPASSPSPAPAPAPSPSPSALMFAASPPMSGLPPHAMPDTLAPSSMEADPASGWRPSYASPAGRIPCLRNRKIFKKRRPIPLPRTTGRPSPLP